MNGDTCIAFLLATGGTAMRCVTELLNNLEIQENKVSSREIDLFIGMLRAGGINHTLMTVLGALCSCQDQGIDSNQTMLTGVLLLRSEDLLVKFFVVIVKFFVVLVQKFHRTGDKDKGHRRRRRRKGDGFHKTRLA